MAVWILRSWSTLLLFLVLVTCDRTTAGKRRPKIPKTLLGSMMEDYDSLFRPNEGNSLNNTTTVFFSIVLLDVFCVEGTLQAKVTFSVWLKFEWEDSRLSWNRDTYNYHTVRLPLLKIWKPDIRLLNNLDANPEIDWGVKAVVNSNGLVTAKVPAELSIHCGRPRDPHANWECILKFGSWTYNGLELNLRLKGTKADTTEYNSRVWHITGNRAELQSIKYDCCPENFINIQYNVRVIRQ